MWKYVFIKGQLRQSIRRQSKEFLTILDSYVKVCSYEGAI